MEHVESTESWVEHLHDHNYRLRVRMLQKMRGHSLQETTRAAWTEWRAAVHAASGERKMVSLRNRMLARFLPMFVKMIPGAWSDAMLRKMIFKAWTERLSALKEENKLLDEINLHRQGRTQLINQYRELESELLDERQSSIELRDQLNHSNRVAEALQQELGATNFSLVTTNADLRAAQERAEVFAAQVSECQERAAAQRRELYAESEKAKRLAQQAAQLEAEKKEVVERLHRSEQLLENARLQAAHHEGELRRAAAAGEEKDARLRVLEQQLAEATSCIQSLSLGASQHLYGAKMRSALSHSSLTSPQS